MREEFLILKLGWYRGLYIRPCSLAGTIFYVKIVSARERSNFMKEFRTVRCDEITLEDVGKEVFTSKSIIVAKTYNNIKRFYNVSTNTKKFIEQFLQNYTTG